MPFKLLRSMVLLQMVTSHCQGAKVALRVGAACKK
jgi:hypothetical protein